MPPRTTLVVRLTLLLGRPHIMLQFSLPRSTQRYSAFTLRLVAKEYSRPPPTVQPVFVLSSPVKGGATDLMLPTARPPVAYGSRRSTAKPKRPRTVDRKSFLVSQSVVPQLRALAWPRRFVQSPSPSRP